jgi:hypothetical protein
LESGISGVASPVLDDPVHRMCLLDFN